MFDLLDELHRAPSGFDLPHQALLNRLGLPGDLMLFIPALAVAPIETDGDLFQFADHGLPALVLPVFCGAPPSFARPSKDDPEKPFDVVAFRPGEPGRWWWRVGAADLLGEHVLWSANTWWRPLSLVPTPLDYLRTRCGAVCLLHPDGASKLRDVPTVVVTDLALGRRIDRLLKKPPAGLPKIMVRKDFENELR
jgi:hypothetical protein